MQSFRKILLGFISLCILTSGVSSYYYQSPEMTSPNGDITYNIQAKEKDSWIINIGKKEIYVGVGYPRIYFSDYEGFFIIKKEVKPGIFQIHTPDGEDKYTGENISDITLFKKDYAYTIREKDTQYVIYNGDILHKLQKVLNIDFIEGVIHVRGIIENKIVLYKGKDLLHKEGQSIGNIFRSMNLTRSVIPIKKDGIWLMSENNEIQHESGNGHIVHLGFSANEESYYYTMKKSNSWVILNQDGKRVSEESKYIPAFSVSPDGKNISYVSFPSESTPKDRNYLYINEKVIDTAHSIQLLGWTNDGTLEYNVKDKKGKIEKRKK